jgi:hypothetical protein
VEVWRNNGGGSFAMDPSYNVGGTPIAAALGDLDADGDLDIVVGQEGEPQIDVLLNEGGGDFDFPVPYVAAEAASMDIADFDSDGDLDVLIDTDQGVMILLNSGVGTFPFAGSFPIGANPTCVAASDLDLDGDTDVALATGYEGAVGIMLNAGGGVLEPPVWYDGGPDPRSVAIADVNGDGLPDVLAANATNEESAPVVILRNLGGGAFGGSMTVDACPDQQSIAAADLNGDGISDAAVTSLVAPDDQVCILLNDPRPPVGQDCNGNGVLDSCEIAPTPAFSVEMYPSGGSVQKAVALGDLNGDDELDLVTAGHGDDSVGVALGNGDGTFAPAITYDAGESTGPWDIALGDFDGDGDLDVAAASIFWNLTILANDGTGVLAPPVTVMTNEAHEAIIAADLDGDDDIDLATGNQGETISVLLNDGDGTFSQQHYVGAGPGALTAADIDGDDDLDLIAAAGMNAIAVLEYLGNGEFAAPVTYPSGTQPEDIAVADLNDDGHPDLAVACADEFEQGDPSLDIFFNNGDGTFGSRVPYDVNRGARGVGAADLDGDGDLDLAVASMWNGVCAVFTNNGAGAFGVAFTEEFMDQAMDAEIADFDGDGNPDVAVCLFDEVGIMLGGPLPPAIDDCNENGIPDDCDIASGESEDVNGNGVPDECEELCPEDIDGDGVVNVVDLLALLGAWGMCDCAEDIDGDGVVNVVDLLAVLAAWGPC